MQLSFNFPALFNEQGSLLGSCKHCGDTFESLARATKGPRILKYCSAECRNKAQAKPKRTAGKCYRCERIILNPGHKQRQCGTCTHFYAMVTKGRDFARYLQRKGNTQSTPYGNTYCNTCFRLLGRSGSPYGPSTHNCNHCNPPEPKPEPASELVRAWPRIYVKNCRWCDSHFLAPNGRAIHCSDQCTKEADTHSKRASGRRLGHIRDERLLVCTGCGTPLGRNKWRCAECVRLTKAESRSRRKRKRRALLLDRGTEPYTLMEIAQRDELICGICAEPVDLTLAVPEPGAPTIDHILPIAKGGDNTKANVQLAHFECNWIKGDSEWASLTHKGGRHGA